MGNDWTIRGVDEDVKERLHRRAAGNGRSMAEEARLVLTAALSNVVEPPPRTEAGTESLWDSVRMDVDATGRIEVEPLARACTDPSRPR